MSSTEAAQPPDTVQSAGPVPGGLAVIGAGVLGETILSGLLRSGWPAERLIVTHRRPERLVEIEARYGVATAGNVEAVRRADTVMLAVKPQDLIGVLDEIADQVGAGTLVVSLCAGVATDLVESRLPTGCSVVRVMVNTPAQVDQAMAAISAGAHATNAQLDQVAEILGAVGRTVTLPERYLDAVTAISGSGPAYLFFVVESMIEAGVHLGLPRGTATELVVQTMLGSATLLRSSGEHPTVLRERVTSPGGTTAAALRQLEDHKVRAAFITAIEAAHDRSRELADGARRQTTPVPGPAGTAPRVDPV